MKQPENTNYAAIFILPILLAFISCSDGSRMSGNPIFPGDYADPEVAVFGGRYWIFPTRSADFDSQVALDAFSSTDLVNWEKHENILDTTGVKWVRRALWAPAIVEKDNLYYLFFGANDIQHPLSRWWKPEMANQSQYGGIGIAVAEKPEGPYIDYLGKPLISEFYNDAQPIDQFIFKDRQDHYYIIYGGWGRCNIGILNDDFTALVPFEDGTVVKEITPDGYVEGSVMFYRNDKVYFMWSEGNWTDSSYNVAYAIADSPYGPFARIGNIFVQDTLLATGAGHNSVLNIPGTDEWYIVYHRRPVPNQHRDHRVTCIEYLHFNDDGTIAPVEMTRQGVALRPLN
jgi:beta-xylosidase